MKSERLQDVWRALRPRDKVIVFVAAAVVAAGGLVSGAYVAGRGKAPVSDIARAVAATVTAMPTPSPAIVEKVVKETVIVEKPVSIVVEEPVTMTIVIREPVTTMITLEEPAVVAVAVAKSAETLIQEIAAAPTPLPTAAAAPAVESVPLPALYVVYDDAGEPSVFGLQASDIEAWLAPWVGPDSLWMLRIHPFYINWIKAANVQHIEGVLDSKGIFLFVNGEPLPYLAWDGESLDHVSQMAQTFAVPYADLIRPYLPLLRHIGLDIVIQMPLAEGATPIPYRDPRIGLMEVTEAPQAISKPPVVTHMEVVYDERGVPHIGGISVETLEALTGVSLWGVKLDPTVMAYLQAANIQHITLMREPEGLHLLVNGRDLPFLAWDEELLSNALDLYVRSNAPSPMVDLVKEGLREVSRSDVKLTIRFPLAGGAQPLSLP
ncbi:MAG: hypothetical protein H8D78_21740 [Chloroflexi bacterium]|nr:hypothetical protein [Chloroflexota bacterium]